MGILMKCWGGWAAYGVARGLRSEGFQDDFYSTRVVLSLTNGVFYGLFFYIPMMRLANRIQIRMEDKNPEDYPDVYHEILMTNRNVIL
jgi:hypothetical protein